MAYSLTWRSPALPFVQKQTPISVPAGGVVSNAASLTFTGKGAANYGVIQQENQIRLLENFAGPTAPSFPTVGQTWFDTANNVLKVCVATAPQPITWRSMSSTQITEVGEEPPAPVTLGDTWFERTGSVSGIQYVYTGVGRYPATDWDATASSYFPVTSTTLAAKLNYSTFTVQNFGEGYIHGFTSSTPADVDGSILVNSVVTSVPRGLLATGLPSQGYILWDTTNTLVSTASVSTHFFSIRQLIDGRWQFDNNEAWVTFTPIAGMYVIGTITVSNQDVSALPGVTEMTMWSVAEDLREMLLVPSTLTNGGIGGWMQVHPPVDTAAGREEYSFIAGLVSNLIGDAAAFGGAGAIGRSIDYLTPLNTLDASMQQAWNDHLPHDINVLNSSTLLNQLRLDLNSQDWDKLLAAAKYAVNRLELPAGMVSDISDVPFVHDGRPAPATLLAKSSNSVEHPSDFRKTNPRLGLITLNRLYQETTNVLQAAIANRYILKGMQGTSGVNTTFDSNVSTNLHAAFTANSNGTQFSSAVTHGVAFNFDSADLNLQRFFYAGQAIELIVQKQSSGSPTAADVNIGNVCTSFGRFRLTADAVYVMDNSVTPGLTQVPGSLGFTSVTPGGITLASVSIGGASLVFRAFVNVQQTIVVYIDVVAGGATTGTIQTTWNLIIDNETYGSSVRVFPLPIAYQSADKQGSVLFV